MKTNLNIPYLPDQQSNRNLYLEPNDIQEYDGIEEEAEYRFFSFGKDDQNDLVEVIRKWELYRYLV